MSGPRPLRALLESWRPPRAAGSAPGADGDEAGILAAAWREAVGQDVARRTRPGKYRDGTLQVLTAGSAWSHQLTFLAPAIIERLRERAPGVPLQRLRFIVATGRTRVLLDRGIEKRTRANAPARHALTGSNDPVPHGRFAGLKKRERTLDDVLAELRSEQAALDERRARAGWRRCLLCGTWSEGAHCQPCLDEMRRKSDARIALALSAAPWQSLAEVEQHAHGVEEEAFERVRRRLRTKWEQHIHNADRRLRRGALEAGDRVAAWSFVMLVARRPQADVARPVVEGLLGKEWADVLCADKARPRLREKN
jgi:hypothetical protein